MLFLIMVRFQNTSTGVEGTYPIGHSEILVKHSESGCNKNQKKTTIYIVISYYCMHMMSDQGWNTN